MLRARRWIRGLRGVVQVWSPVSPERRDVPVRYGTTRHCVPTLATIGVPSPDQDD